ncbi:DUF3820 family protein [Winogradskyella poriferorum]|uniref:DUF3820 family protein n=1 Tax=Winogradskyella poriferorum TaxID=307627 RepID=UPI003D64A43E
MEGDKNALIELAHYKMPFGKYKGSYLIDIPEYYFTWFKQKGFPQGKLGVMMTQMHDIKINGLDEIIRKIKQDFPR